jgi:hypothetical protein
MDWLIGILGAVLGYLLNHIGVAIRWLRSLGQRTDLLERQWHEYHFSRKNSLPILRHDKFSFKKKGKNEFEVHCSAEDEYKGSLVKVRGHLVIHLIGAKSYVSHWDIRLLEPVPKNEKILPGLWIGFDFDGKIISGPIILSQELLTNTQATQYLQQLIQITNVDHLLLGLP